MTYKDRAEKIAKKPKYIQLNFYSTKGLHWKYLRYRFLRPWLKLYKKWTLQGLKDVPWLTPAAIEILDNLYEDTFIGLEYGSGKSTLFHASRIRYLVSVEHHAEWYQNVSDWISTTKLDNVDFHLIEPAHLESNHEIELRNQLEFDDDNSIYKDYFEFVTTFSNEQFDFILIDGRARVECSKKAIDKLKSGGIFILDNSERPRYKPVHDLLKSWPTVNTTCGLTDTTFWFKP